jgi:hypothetical protein
MATINEKMTALADEVRVLSGVSNKIGIDEMTTQVGSANTAVISQADLIAELSTLAAELPELKPLEDIEIVQNGVYTSSDKHNGFGTVTVNVDAGSSTATYVDDSVAYRKIIPTNSVNHCYINSIGGMTYKCNNLIPFPYVDKSTVTRNGITYTINEDGSITANGTATGQAYFVLFRGVLPIGEYFLSGTPRDGSTNTIIYVANTNYSLYKADVGIGVAFNITTEEEMTIAISIQKEVIASNLVFKPMVNLGSTALPYEPYYEGLRDTKATAIKSNGANLIPFPYVDTTKTVGGITFTDNGDGGITVKGTSTAFASFILAESNGIKLEHGQAYSQNGNSDVTFCIAYDDANGNRNYWASPLIPFVWDNSYTLVKVYIQVMPNKTVNTVVYPMLNLGTTAAPYKPYREPITYIIPEELQGTCKGVAGYNDTVDFERGKYIKRCETIVLNGAEDWQEWTSGTRFYYMVPPYVGTETVASNFICTHFDYGSSNNNRGLYVQLKVIRAYVAPQFPTLDEWKAYLSEQYASGNPVTLTYALGEPIETDLTGTIGNIIEVEGGGCLEFVNEHKYAVPSTITYQLLV